MTDLNPIEGIIESMTNPEPLSVVPDPTREQLLTEENLMLNQAIDTLKEQLASATSQVNVLEQHKEEILERLQLHEKNNFSCVLANLENGDVIADLSEKILELSKLVEERQEAGKLTLTIKMEVFQAGAQVATAEVKVAEPKRENKPSIFFCDGESITRNNNKQNEFNY